jgi:hypothetical protein
VKAEIDVILKQNITLVYDGLELSAIDTRQLKGLVESQPVVMDTPEVIVIIFPAEHTVVQMDERRIRVTLQEHSEELGGRPLWDMAVACHRLVDSGLHSSLTAYGFNYDAGFVLDEDSSAKVMDLFLANRRLIEEVAEARLSAFLPRIRFEREAKRYDLALEPVEMERIKAHLNAHFQTDDLVLPGASLLEKSFRDEFTYFRRVVKELLSRSV